MIRLILAAFLIFTAGTAAAQDNPYYPIGQVVAVEGDAWFVSGSNKRIARPDDPVYMNASVTTGPASKIMILFIDDTQVTLAENSELMIDEFIFDPVDPDENEAEFGIPKGAFEWVSGMIGKAERPNVEINTAFGTIQIDGTQFWAGTVENGHGVFVDSGKIHLDGEWGTTQIPGGSGIFIGKQKDSKPDHEFWSALRKGKAIERVTFKTDLENRVKAIKTENIRKRNDYRGRMSPYKSRNAPGYVPGEDEFFTDEFNEMRDKR